MCFSNAAHVFFKKHVYFIGNVFSDAGHVFSDAGNVFSDAGNMFSDAGNVFWDAANDRTKNARA